MPQEEYDNYMAQLRSAATSLEELARELADKGAALEEEHAATLAAGFSQVSRAVWSAAALSRGFASTAG